MLYGLSILFILLIILVYYVNRIMLHRVKEKFNNVNYLNKMNYSNETMGTFCKKLKMLDRPNEYNILLKKLKNDAVEENEKEIEALIEEINELQSNIINDDISMKNIYRLHTHRQAKKQVDIINKAIENVRNRNKVNVSLK